MHSFVIMQSVLVTSSLNKSSVSQKYLCVCLSVCLSVASITYQKIHFGSSFMMIVRYTSKVRPKTGREGTECE